MVILILSKWWRVASYFSIIIIVIVLITGTILTVPLTPRIVTDKEAYHVGDIIHAKYVFVNTNRWWVTFTPPSVVDGMYGSYSWEHSDSEERVFINWVSRSFVIQPNEAFNILYEDFPVDFEGFFVIEAGLSSKIVQVYP